MLGTCVEITILESRGYVYTSEVFGIKGHLLLVSLHVSKEPVYKTIIK